MHIIHPALLIGLTLIGSLSPLLTAARLWQVKEWRTDRLREHLRAEGALRQLFGIARPAALAPFAIIGIAGLADESLAALGALSILALLTVLQVILRRQPMPVWTAKAALLTITAFLYTALVTLLAASSPLMLPFLVLGQPFLLLCAWLTLRPLDWWLKRRILQRATALRAALPEGAIVIGITGSAGKTTTKELLAHLLADRHPLTTPAHVNTEIGVANWFASALRGQREPPSIIIVEMGAYRRGEIALLCSVMRPTIGIVTSIGKQHIALFGSQQALCSAKGELPAAIPENGRVFLNADNELCGQLKDRARCPVTTVGTGGNTDIEAFEIEEIPIGLRFRMGESVFEVPLRGTHNVTNALLAIAVAQHCGMQLKGIAARMRTFVPPAHTFALRQERGVQLLDDTHNASPASVEAAITWARSQPASQKVLLMNGLIELGESQDKIHTKLGAFAAQVFHRVVFASQPGARAFSRGLGKPVEVLGERTQPVTEGTLLVCVGRMNERTLTMLLPQ